MLIMERGRKKGGQLSTKLNLFDYKEFNLQRLVLLSESSVRNPADTYIQHDTADTLSLSLSLSPHTHTQIDTLPFSLIHLNDII